MYRHDQYHNSRYIGAIVIVVIVGVGRYRLFSVYSSTVLALYIDCRHIGIIVWSVDCKRIGTIRWLVAEWCQHSSPSDFVPYR